jgi:Tol biopolymer transport system component
MLAIGLALARSAQPQPSPTVNPTLFTSALCGTQLIATAAMFAANGRTAAPIGQFDDHADVGAVQIPGSASYDAVAQEYVVQSSGTNMWGDHDEFHFVWKRVKGDFLVQTTADFVGKGVEQYRKLGVVVRASLDPRSPQINACRHGSGLASLQFRRGEGAPTEEKRFEINGPDFIQLSRIGGVYTMSVARFGETLVSQSLGDVALGDEVYVGLCVCAHNNGVSEKAVFRNVRLIRPAKEGFVPYRDYIGSDLELLDVATGRRQVVDHVADSVQAPNWTPDGRALVVNHNGRMYRFDLAQRKTEPIDTGAQTANNNDHALSFDGRMLGISSGQPSMVYVVPVTGGTPRLVPPKGPSYFHGWSPDGRYLAYTGLRESGADIYRIPVDGGPEERLTSAKGLNDGSEYTPDGKHIYFISERTGRMQIWRMNSDGSDQVQITNDEYNNWFPHVSPDGKSIVFLTYGPEIKSGDHPFYKHVYLRRMSTDGGKPTVIAYVYGGQGSMNVNSWSPDSKSIAFVSNGDPL